MADSTASPSRLQLGTSRLEELDPRVLDTFLDKSWIHLGDAPSAQRPRSVARYLGHFRRHPVRSARQAIRTFGRRLSPAAGLNPDTLYERTNFRPFYFKRGDRLPFDDETFGFIFSEHFFHHLFLDDAVALFRECQRVLKTGGVIRTIVPDADLRTYEPPEPAGFPDVRMSFLEPLKHKTRYSVYMLEETLRLSGFEPVSLRYCDRHGEYIRKNPREMREVYAGCPEKSLVFALDYVMRPDSLIVDGIKKPA